MCTAVNCSVYFFVFFHFFSARDSVLFISRVSLSWDHGWFWIPGASFEARQSGKKIISAVLNQTISGHLESGGTTPQSAWLSKTDDNQHRQMASTRACSSK